jgi:hypothetical protein
MSTLIFTPYKGTGVFTPQQLDNKIYWFDSVSVGLIPVDQVNTMTNKYSPAAGIAAAVYTAPRPILGTPLLNGRQAMANGLVTRADTTTPSNLPVIAPGQPFTMAFVHQGPALASGTFYQVLNMSSGLASTSIALFYANLPGSPIYYLQTGNGAVQVVGASAFTPTAPHAAVLGYNGGGYANASSWTLIINGVVQTVAVNPSSGGTTASNFISDGSGGGASAPLYYWEFLLAGVSTPTLTTQVSNYLLEKYNL